jgi:hypothetical protein
MSDLAPTQVARTFFDALIRADWQGAVTLADPAGLATWRRGELAFLAAEADSLADWPARPAGGSLASVPTDEAVVAERLRARAAIVVPGLTPRTTLAELVALPASKLLAMYLQLTASLRMASASGPGPQIVGETIENETSGFVVYRWRGAGWPKEPQEASILRLHRGDEGWRYFPTPDVGSPCFAHALLWAANNDS